MKKGLFIFFIFLSTVFSQKNELKNLKVLSYTNKSELVKNMKVVSKDLGVDLTNRIQQLKVEEPPKRKGGIKVSSVAELVSKLKNEAKVI